MGGGVGDFVGASVGLFDGLEVGDRDGWVLLGRWGTAKSA